VIFLRRPDGGLELAGKYIRPGSPAPVPLPPITLAVKAAVDMACPAGAGLDQQVVPLDAEALIPSCRYRTIAVPIHAKGQLFGGLAMSSLCEQQPFGRPELNLLTAFGQQLAASVENAELYGALKEREVRLEELVGQLVNAQEAERARIARELHDETGQKLSALVMGLAAAESFLANDPGRAARAVHEMRAMAEASIDELRNIMANLRPSQLDDLGLVPAMRWYVQRYRDVYPDVTVNLALERAGRRLPAEYETILFRVTQEALTNIARHSHATQVDLQLSYEPGTVRLRIADNGIGFEQDDQPRRRDGGWGLVGIRERVALVSGSCEIVSRRDVGTCITVELPLTDGIEVNT
jgi:signal transduction histidine kinase